MCDLCVRHNNTFWSHQEHSPVLCPWTPEKSPEQKGPEHEMQTSVSSVLFFQAYKVHPSILQTADSEVQKDAVRLMYSEKAERSCPRCVNPLPSRHAPIAFSVLCRAGHMSPILQAMTSILPQLMGLVWTHARAEHLGSCYIKAEEHGSWGFGAMGGSTDSMSNW